MKSLVARSLPVGLVVLVGGALVACGSSSSRTRFEAGDAGPSSSSTDAPSSGFVPADAGPSSGDGCSDEAKLVYVLSFDGDLYSFAPAAKKFTKVGALNCELGGATLIPISMAVDRNAVAWVNMRDALGGGDGVLFEVDTKTAKCKPSGIAAAFGGMGFSINAGSTAEDTLFVVAHDVPPGGRGIARVDFAKQKVVPIAVLPELDDLELTGTGDGRLFGFLMSSPLAIAQVDKSTAAYSKRVQLAGVEKPTPPLYAFSFWGGDFYVYTATTLAPQQSTNVARYRPSDGSLDTEYMTSIGFHIVGAGVSTCAPTVSPN